MRLFSSNKQSPHSVQTKGFSGAIFKRFKTNHDAEAFMQSNGSSSKSSSAASILSGNKRGRKRPPEIDARSNQRRKIFNQQQPSPNSTFQLQITIHFDGGSRGNPGVAGAGAHVIVVDNSKGTLETMTYSIRRFCGNRETNNYAEYNGLLAGLELAKSCIEECSSNRSAQSPSPLFQLQVYGDSNLIIQQLKGAWQCKNANIKPLFRQSQQLIGEMKRLDAKSEVLLEHVYREQNKVADGEYWIVSLVVSEKRDRPIQTNQRCYLLSTLTALANEAMDRRQSWTTTVADSPVENEKPAAGEMKRNNQIAPSSGKRDH